MNKQLQSETLQFNPKHKPHNERGNMNEEELLNIVNATPQGRDYAQSVIHRSERQHYVDKAQVHLDEQRERLDLAEQKVTKAFWDRQRTMAFRDYVKAVKENNE